MNVNNLRGAVEAAKHVALSRLYYATMNKCGEIRRRLANGEISSWEARSLMKELKTTMQKAQRNILEA